MIVDLAQVGHSLARSAFGNFFLKPSLSVNTYKYKISKAVFLNPSTIYVQTTCERKYKNI